MSKVVHFEFSTPDPGTEIKFFETMFGWSIQRWGEEEYWLIDTGAEEIGVNGAIMSQRSPDQPRVVDTISVSNIDEALVKAVSGGGTIALDKQVVPNIGWTAYVVSPTGIMFGLLEAMPGSMSGSST